MIELASLAANAAASIDAFQEKPFFWQSKLFDRDTWNSLTFGLRMVLTLGGAMMLLYWWRARKLGEKFREKSLRNIGIVMMVLSFGVYFDFFNPNVRYPDYYHRHEFFHYYLGSKFSEELGYKRIYECAAIAEIENGRGAAVARRELRNLRVNLIQPVNQTDVYKNPDLCKRFFQVDTPAGAARWEMFKKDVAWFQRTSAGSYWENMQKDHGYNPPPVWTMTGKFFANMGSPGEDCPPEKGACGFFLKLAALDPIFHAAAIGLFWWAFGWRVATVAAVFWGVNAPANFYWTGGAFLRQDWIVLVCAAICLLRKRRFAMAGAAIAWSTLLRVFPVVITAGVLIIMAFHFIKYRKLHKDHLRFLGGGVLFGIIAIPISSIVTAPQVQEEGSTTPAIVAPYKMFFDHIFVHDGTPLTNHMGVETMVVHDWFPSVGSFFNGTWRDEPNGRMRFTRNDNLDDPFKEWKDGRRDRKKERWWLLWGLRLLSVGWLAWALRRTKLLWVGMALSPIIVMGAVNMTCYYFSIFMVGAALSRARPLAAPMLMVGSGASQILLGNYYWVDDKFTAQSYLFFAIGLLLLFAYSRPFSLERLRAWLEGKPEPKSPKPEPKALPQPAE